MTADDVRALILEQIGSDWAKTNLHGIRVGESLLPPTIVDMVYPSFSDGKRIEHLQPVWLVLEECEDGSGYKIIYDEVDSTFGLATPGKNGQPAVVVGNYSRFIDAFNGM